MAVAFKAAGLTDLGVSLCHLNGRFSFEHLPSAL
jgi:hypothetical protein